MREERSEVFPYHLLCFLEPSHYTRYDGAIIVLSWQCTLGYRNLSLPGSISFRYAEFKEFGVLGYFADGCV